MSKKLKESSQMSPLAEYGEKNLHSPSYANKSDANKSPPSSPRFVSSYFFTINVALVMVTNATTIEEQLASLTRAIKGLMQDVQEQDTQIARLINKTDNVDASHVMGKQAGAHDEVEAPPKQHYTEKDKLSKASVIKMCIQGMHWGFHYVLQGILPKSFEELATRAHDIELSMTASGVEGSPIQELRGTKEKQEEMQAREYPFLDSNVSGIFDDLLEANLIDLPEMKRPKEAEMKA
ncbi:UNVERIFIED_CONTAM: hypothetical protein Scaly_0484500 [Sesamum calycinum]|uniref:Uncharacterized protein n=1 Tax=Sesamum calycinum TaxID=2727403 RepID=A0AAW2RPG6_9LAMI